MQELCIVNHTIIYLFIDICYYFKIDSEIDVQIDLKKRSCEPREIYFSTNRLLRKSYEKWYRSKYQYVLQNIVTKLAVAP